MAALNFPNAPAVGAVYSAAGVAWKYDGVKWNAGMSNASYLPLSGGQMLGPIVLSADPAAPLQPASKQYSDAGDAASQAAAQAYTDNNYVALAGDTMTGGLNGTTFGFSGVGSVGGLLTASGGILAGGSVDIDNAAGVPHSFRGKSSGSFRWVLQLGDGTAETGSNAGANLAIAAMADNGSTVLSTPITINRASGAVVTRGTQTSDNAAAGQVGEAISSIVNSPGVTLTTAVAANVTSISLTAGDWDVQGEVWFAIGTGAATGLHGGITPTSATVPGAPATNSARLTYNGTIGASAAYVGNLKPCRVSLSATTTYYLIAMCVFPSGTTTAYGMIWARRAR